MQFFLGVLSVLCLMGEISLAYLVGTTHDKSLFVGVAMFGAFALVLAFAGGVSE